MNVRRLTCSVAYYRVGSHRVPMRLDQYADLTKQSPGDPDIQAVFSRQYGPTEDPVVGYLSDCWHLWRSEWDAISLWNERGAITVGSTASASSDFATSLTYAFNNVAGDFMWTLCANDRSGSGTTIDTITYAAAGLTLQTALGSGGRATRMGHKVAPATGSNNVVQTNSTTNTKPMSESISYLGVDQVTPISDVQTLNTTASDATWTVASATGDFVCAGAITTTAGQAFTPGTDTNERLQVDFTGVGSGFFADEPGGASITINETMTSAVVGGYAFSLKAAGGGAPATTVFRQMISSTMRPGSRPMGAA